MHVHRPIVVTPNDPENTPLTPNHVITMTPSNLLPPPGLFVKEDLYIRKRWRRVQFIAEQFWSRWRKEYLASLQKRQKWITAQRNLTVGDIVLVTDHDTPRSEWPMAIVKAVKIVMTG